MRFFEFIKNNWIMLGIIVVLVITNVFTIFIIGYDKNKTNVEISEPITELNEEVISDINPKIKIDIKGAVKKPGVYEMNANDIVNDVIIASGGLKSNATTKNINLSKKLTDEMVIYISTTSELKKEDSSVTQTVCEENTVIIEKCENANIVEAHPSNENEVKEDNKDNDKMNNKDIDNSTTTSKININTATKEELMTLNGVGESKALSIIEYRNQNSFKTIEEIMNISGIGEAVFAKIKDNITI